MTVRAIQNLVEYSGLVSFFKAMLSESEASRGRGDISEQKMRDSHLQGGKWLLLTLAVLLFTAFQFMAHMFIKEKAGKTIGTDVSAEPSNDYSTISKHARSTELLPVTMKQEFSGCLLVKDDNALLPEWIAYHSIALPLTNLIVAVDPDSVSSPRSVLERFNSTLNWTLWHDEDYIKPPMPKKSCDVLNPRRKEECHRVRQATFMVACLREVKRVGGGWTALVDTDEYVVINNDNVETKDLQASGGSYSTALDHLHLIEEALGKAHTPCLVLPRLFFSAVETPGAANATSLPKETMQTVSTLRFRAHAKKGGFEHNRFGKTLIDVSRIDSFPKRARNPHQPLQECLEGTPTSTGAPYETALFRVHHYLGSWERYSGRNDSRRSREAFDTKNFVNDGSDDSITSWFDEFIDRFGPKQALDLLDVGTGKENSAAAGSSPLSMPQSEACTVVSGVPFLSQGDEDKALFNLFYSNPPKCGGLILEIGALDGLKWSNSFFFEQALGWRSLLIEASPSHFSKLQKNRPQAMNVHAAMCTEKHVSFQGGLGPAMGGIVQDMPQSHKHNNLNEIVEVPCRQFEAVFAEYGIRHVDVFVLDVEGSELSVLKTMDWTVTVDVWVVELSGQNMTKDAEVRALLLMHGYEKPAWDISELCTRSRCTKNEAFVSRGSSFANAVSRVEGRG